MGIWNDTACIIKLDNETYTEPSLLSEKKNHYFSENKIDFILSDNDNVLTSLPKDKIELIRRKLIAFEKIDQKDIKTIVNKNIAVNNLIINNEDIINEGNKIITWIDKVLKKEVFKDLITHIHDDYIYITRKGTKIKDVITKDLVSNLKYFDWQYNNPIDYDTLKYVIKT